MKIKLFTIISLVLYTSIVFSQRHGGFQGGQSRISGSVYGLVVDIQTSKPAEYTNIIIRTKPDSTLITGVITNKRGEYYIKNLKPGEYYLIADFIGYKKQIHTFSISPKVPNVKIETIKLVPGEIDLDEIEVTAEKAQVEYKIDKKVIHVKSDLASSSGTAADVLENTPSIQVDIEGNVSLRGSSNFTVLINGKPSILEASDALQQIPASTIKDIEIITNPSAKFDPDGTAGIVNIITNKKEDDGISGVFNAGIGLRNKYKADALISYKKNKITVTGGLDYRNDNFTGTRENERTTFTDSVKYHYDSEGEHQRNRGGYSGKIGFDWDISDRTMIGVSGKAGVFGFSFGGYSFVKEYTEPQSVVTYHMSEGDKPRSRDFYETNFNFVHKFNYFGHKLEGSVVWTDRSGASDQITDEWDTDENRNMIDNTFYQIIESETENNAKLRTKLDYVLPFSTDGKFEAGYQSRLDSETELFKYVSQYSYAPELNGEFNSEMNYKRNIHAVYSTYTNTFAGFGLMLGLRGEYTDRYIYGKAEDKAYELNRFDYFPSIHLSKELAKNNKLQLSFSKRINRPRGYSLEPFTSYRNENNVRQGNPDLLPEFIYSAELNWQKRFMGRSFIALETFYRYTNNLITHLHTLGENNVVIHTFENMNADMSLGGELMLNLMLGRTLNINASGSLYQYEINGEIDGESIDSQSLTWNVNTNTTYKLTPWTRFQLMLGYRGPSVSAQGSSAGFLMNSIGIRQDLFKRKLNVTLQVRNFLGTMKHDRTVESSVLYEHSTMYYEFPMAMLNLTFYLNKKPEREKRDRGDNGGDDMDGGE